MILVRVYGWVARGGPGGYLARSALVNRMRFLQEQTNGGTGEHLGMELYSASQVSRLNGSLYPTSVLAVSLKQLPVSGLWTIHPHCADRFVGIDQTVDSLDRKGEFGVNG